ncbi:MAG: DUF2281 domain-containing protein [Polaromonas sp.]
MSTTAERLWETVSSLPEPLLAEVLDFAESLRSKQAQQLTALDDLSLSSLCGGLEQSATFAGSPLSIQQRLRDEWR